MVKVPWQCGYCRKTQRATANNCMHCGGSWEDAVPDFVPPEPRAQSRKHHNETKQENWGYDGYGKSPRSSRAEPSWNQRPRTPRGGRRQPAHDFKGKNQQKGKNPPGQKGVGLSGKGKSSAGGSDGYAPLEASKGLPPEPPWRPTLQSMPMLPPVPPPSTPHPDTQAVQTLNKLTAAIKKQPEKFDPEVHAILQGASLAEGLSAQDMMLKAVSDLGSAREALDAARLGRYQNHVKWRDFLTSAVQRWQEYTTDFQRQEKEFTEAIENAQTFMANAKERFETGKATLTADQLAAVATVSGDDPMVEKVEESASGKALQQGWEDLAAQLASWKSSAEVLVAEEQAAKRQRTDDGDVPLGVPSSATRPLGSGALEPFAARPEDASFQEPGKR